MANKTNSKLDILKRRLEEYYRAESKILEGQSYSIGSRQLTRTELKTVQSKIKELEVEIEAIERHGTKKRRAVRAVPCE